MNKRRRYPFPRVVGLAILLTQIHSVGCRTGGKAVAEPESVRVLGRWLEKNVSAEVTRKGVNPKSGLYEIDAVVTANGLEPGRLDGYRVVARTLFYRGGRETLVDTSAWAELAMIPGKPVGYSCSSLEPADDFVIEVGYPEEAGLR
jgi:hypothetical protein